MKKLIVLLLLILPQVAFAQNNFASNDPFVLGEAVRSDGPQNNTGNASLSGKSCRTDAGGSPCNPTINGAQKTLALFILGTSNSASIGPSAYSPTNGSAIDNLNIYDGALYVAADPLLGQTTSFLGPGSFGIRIADLLITNGIFDRVILITGGVGGSYSGFYGANGPLYQRGCVAVKRLAARGVTSSTPGLTMALLYMGGENEGSTSSADFQAAVQQQVARMQSCGFSGRIFIPTQTILANSVNSTIQNGQAALAALGSPWFAGGNLDSLTGATNRQADGTHFTNTGLASGATLVYNAMHATGAPF